MARISMSLPTAVKLSNVLSDTFNEHLYETGGQIESTREANAISRQLSRNGFASTSKLKLRNSENSSTQTVAISKIPKKRK